MQEWTHYIHVGGMLTALDDELPATATITFDQLQLTNPTNVANVTIPYTYRYGFNGQEHVNELNSSSYDFGARMYDSRIGRWFSPDAIFKPSLSSFQFGKCNPIIYIDPDGNDEIYFMLEYTAIVDGFGRKLGPGTLTIKVVPNEEVDKFIVVQNIRVYKEVCEIPQSWCQTNVKCQNVYQKTETSTTNLNPTNQKSKNEITKHKSTFCDGLFGIEIADPDNVTIGKFMLMNSSFSFYLESHNTESKKWKTNAIMSNNLDAVCEFAQSMFFFGVGLIFEGLLIINETKSFTKAQRLEMFKNNLSSSPCPSNPKDAITLINKTLDDIETKFASNNDRMYGILDDKYVTYNADGTVTALTKGQRIEISVDGSFKIYNRSDGSVFFTKTKTQ